MKVSLLFLFCCLSLSSLCQGNTNYDYLKTCPGIRLVDTTMLEIDGIGEVEVFGFGIVADEEAELSMYQISPVNAKKKASKLLNSAVDTHVGIWKNNSSILLRKTHSAGDAKVSDLRLHIRIENIFMQVVTVLDGNTIYQVLRFSDSYDEIEFDELTRKLLARQCL